MEELMKKDFSRFKRVLKPIWRNTGFDKTCSLSEFSRRFLSLSSGGSDDVNDLLKLLQHTISASELVLLERLLQKQPEIISIFKYYNNDFDKAWSTISQMAKYRLIIREIREGLDMETKIPQYIRDGLGSEATKEKMATIEKQLKEYNERNKEKAALEKKLAKEIAEKREVLFSEIDAKQRQLKSQGFFIIISLQPTEYEMEHIQFVDENTELLKNEASARIYKGVVYKDLSPIQKQFANKLARRLATEKLKVKLTRGYLREEPEVVAFLQGVVLIRGKNAEKGL